LNKRILITILVILLSGCTNVDNEVQSSEIDNLQTRIEELESTISEKDLKIKKIEQDNLKYVEENKEIKGKLASANNDIDKRSFEDENYRNISYLTLEFARARTSGDIEKLKSLVSRNVRIYEENNEIWSEFVNTKYCNLLHFPRREKYYHDMHIIYFEYDKENETFKVHTEEYFVNDDGEISGIAFVYMTYIKEDNEWKIDDFDFDI